MRVLTLTDWAELSWLPVFRRVQLRDSSAGMPHVLIVDDDANTRAALVELSACEGFTATEAADLRGARIALGRSRPAAVLVDLHLPDGDGMALLAEMDAHRHAEVILITGNASVDTAVEALRRGASDYLVKPVNIERLKAVLARVMHRCEASQEENPTRKQHLGGDCGAMLGSSMAMQSLYDQIQRVAATDATVLLVGESGTGKELAAQTLHERSERRSRPFLPVNCGAISPQLIESELFGHERGSFTGADRQHKGHFERAHGGTLFLDEITEMPIEAQAKLLRALETGRFMRVGSHHEIDVDVRVIAATNRDPVQAVARNQLRADLYHRLNVFPLHLPPLRERGDDIRTLAQGFLDGLNSRHGTHKTFSPEAIHAMRTSTWPGNVRELRNHVERAYILADQRIEAPPATLADTKADPPRSCVVSVPIGTSLAEADRRLILATLEQCGGVKKWAAERLGISLKTLYNRLEAYRKQTREADVLREAEPEMRREQAAS